MPNVTVIPATKKLHTGLPADRPSHRRAAGYARVSTDSDEQFTSYEAQVDYYTKYIKQNPEWDFVDVYTDEGISATNTKHRTGFNDMISDALAGKIDLIITKSVSRFARNTVDSLTTIRKLKEHGVEVYFEKESIWTFDGKGELLLTIMSSLAQEESRSISENITWGKRKQFSDGKVYLPYKHFLGYKKGADGLPEVVPEEAAVVRRIYSEYMAGKTTYVIADGLTADCIPTPAGKSRWAASTVNSILKNEKYRGSAVLQKTFTVDFLTKKMKVNEGEIPQYYVENSHEAIIAPEEWDAVQAEMHRRSCLGGQYSSQSVLASRIVCGDCGSRYGSKVWHSNSKYRRSIMQCNSKFKGADTCQTPNLLEDDVKERFISAWCALSGNAEEQLENCREIQRILCDTETIDRQIAELQDEIEVVTELTRRCIEENSITASNQNEFRKRYESLVQRYETAREKLGALNEQKVSRRAKADEIGRFMFELSEGVRPLMTFDDRLFVTVIDTVTAYSDGRLIFKFKNGSEIEG